MDYKELQQFQDIYSNVTKLFIFCMANDGQGINRVTEISGDPLEVDRLLSLLSSDQITSAVVRVLGNSLEEQVIEDTEYSNIKIATIGVKIAGKPAFCWFICGVLDDDEGENAVKNFHTTLSESDFTKSIDLLRQASNRMYGGLYDDILRGSQNSSEGSSSAEDKEAVRKYRFMNEIVQLLESDEQFDDIAYKIISGAAKFSGISHAYLLKLVNEDLVEIVVDYNREDTFTLDREFEDIPLDTLHSLSDRPSIISYKTPIDHISRHWMDAMDIKGMVVFPVFKNHVPIMYVFFADITDEKTWDLEETKFYSDVVKVLQSVLTRRLQKNSIASSYKSLEAVLDNVGSAIYVRDTESGKILVANKICKSTFSKEMENGKLEELFERGARSNLATSYMEVEYPERRRWYDLNTTHIQWVDGRRVSLNSLFDITDKKMYQQKIEQQANNDFLTGLYNRMCCERDLTRYIDEAKTSGRSGAIIYLDLDDFKHINDGLGHQYGDVLLKAISNSMRRIDGIENTCYRMGGDEFVIIVPCDSYPKFEEIQEEIRVVFNKPWFLKGADYYCTSSIGIVKFPEDGDTVQDLIKKADIAMYQAKKSGKNKVSVYTKEADAESSKRLDMEKSMRYATADGYGEFEVYFQPIVDVKKEGNPCVGAEALLRWNSQDLGFVSPGEFIPLAEYLGLINPIGNHVLEQACIALKHWNENGHPYYKVNVNLSVVQLLQNDIAETIEEIIKRTGINPRNLTLEVTESLAINDMVRMKKILDKIKALGVKIALDDFGTGYSSLNHVREIPIDVIKIDQTFVRNLDTDEYAKSFVLMIGELAQALDVKICVEGIETIEQLNVLESMNVHMIQGYYFGRPMPRKDFEEKYV
ncbi:MAG: EAL domain-containing protein [Lachnospiraceae bacterium]|nr:EAL domain-containing protein [Lachnospiraceae bacterium]